MPPPALPDLDVYGYFRLALATGLEERSAPIAWADRQIMSDRPPTAEILELSLSTRQPYSQLIRLLTICHPSLDYDIPICLLLARAGLLLESGRQTAVELILGLRLLLAEAHIPALLRGSLIELDQSLQDYRAGQLSEQALVDQLAGLLSPYEVYREGLADVDG